MKQEKLTKTSQMTSEVEDIQSSEMEDAERHFGQQSYVPMVITKSLLTFRSLPTHNGNQQQISV